MSAEHSDHGQQSTESSRERLGGRVRRFVETLLELDANLLVLKAIREGNLTETDRDELIAALSLKSGLCDTARGVIESPQADTIFSSDSERKPEVTEEKTGPFAQLLKRKIDETLETGKEEFTTDYLMRFIADDKGIRKAIRDEGLPENQLSFSREEAVSIIQRYLTTPGAGFEGESLYNRTNLMQSFKATANQFNKWGSETGCDWEDNVRVMTEEALQVRGLVKLEEIRSRLAGDLH